MFAPQSPHAVRKKEEIQKYTRLRMGLYEDYKDGLITKEEYLELKEIYGKRIPRLSTRSRHMLPPFCHAIPLLCLKNPEIRLHI